MLYRHEKKRLEAPGVPSSFLFLFLFFPPRVQRRQDLRGGGGIFLAPLPLSQKKKEKKMCICQILLSSNAGDHKKFLNPHLPIA